MSPAGDATAIVVTASPALDTLTFRPWSEPIATHSASSNPVDLSRKEVQTFEQPARGRCRGPLAMPSTAKLAMSIVGAKIGSTAIPSSRAAASIAARASSIEMCPNSGVNTAGRTTTTRRRAGA